MRLAELASAVMALNLSLLDEVRDTVRSRWRERTAHGKRALVTEILSLQVLLTGFVGALAIAGLFWTAKWVSQSHLNQWALQWAAELNELGAPLYISEDAEAVLLIERYIARFPEIRRVVYFDLDGRTELSLDQGVVSPRETSLPQASVDALLSRVGREDAYVVDDSHSGGYAYSIKSPIWTESIAGDGLFAFAADAELETTIEPVGFVQLDLDFSWYYQQIASKVWMASGVLVALLVLYGILGRALLKRGLSSLSDLQKPIADLASGNLQVQFQPAAHREIAAIVDTLKTTAAALTERDESLSRLANHDSLTGLFNRHRFVMELELELPRLAENGGTSALYFIDLDQFKYVNDTCGHPAGDELLKLAAEQIRHSVREEDVVARFGGDEFAVLARGVGREEAEQIGRTLLADMRRLTHVEGQYVFQVQCSIGVAMIDSDRFSVHELVAQADVGCHDAKARGRNRMAFYRVSEQETDHMARAVGWTNRIRRALEEDSFVLHYQPIVDIASGKATHYEVLLRMRGDDDGELIYPNLFLPEAARFGLMAEIDYWVVEKALAELARFREDTPDVRLSINLSAHAFESERLGTRVRRLLEENGLPGESIVFEITEQVAVRHLVDVNKQFSALKSLGCGLAIDDFGAGYSSFTYLKHLPFDYIKIDGEFIRELPADKVDQTMVRLTAEVAKAAGMRTIAEFVENRETLELLVDFGIDYAQGFHIGRPADAPVEPQLPASLTARRRA